MTRKMKVLAYYVLKRHLINFWRLPMNCYLDCVHAVCKNR